MTLPSLDPRLSLAARLRGWTDDATALEQRLKDLETFRRSHRRRWVIAVGLFLIGVVGRFFGAAEVSLTMITAVFSAALIGNALLGIVNERGWYRWWGIYVLAVFDVLLVAVPIVWFGHGGFVAAFFLAILPYTFDQGQAVGDFLVLAGSLAYLGASVLHARWYRDDPNFLTPTVLETVVFVAVAWVLRRIPATLITRIRQARGVIGEAEQGYLAVRAAAAESDELGFLEKSFNRMLDEMGTTISTVQREADEVAAFAEQLAAASQELHASSETVSDTAQQLAGGLGQQRTMAETARGESAKAADQAESLRVRAEMMQVDARRLVAAAERGRERVARASQTLRTVGEEVRALAAEAGKSGREVAELVSELRAGIDAAARAMQSGEAKVRDIGEVAAEADAALQELHEGVQLIGDLVNATAEVSRSQAQRLADLAQSLQQVAAISSSSSQSADGAAAASGAQIASMSDLTATSQQLAQLAERLRAGIARFSVLRRDQATAEYRVPRPVQPQAAD